MPSILLIVVSMLAAMPWRAPAPQQPQRAPQVSRSPHGNLNIACENCHTFTSWKPIRNVPEFDHNKTKYPLRGMHQKVACMQCHTSLVFSNVGTKCADCHADIHKGQFGATCDKCHTVRGWQPQTQQVREHFNRFPLIGAHQFLECSSCHKSAAVGQFRGLSTDCFSCHQQSYQNAKVPDHQALNFPRNCMQCHTNMDTWAGAAFDHLKFTGFALTGAHATLDCTSCHKGGHYQGTPADCYSCHAKDFNGTTNPNHIQAGFPTTCQQCHTTTTWAGAQFDHNKFTKFPLTGAHVTVPCASCHVNGRYAGTPTDCFSCHQNDYNKTTNPNHQQAGFPTTCQQCHSTKSWTDATFDHNLTKFPLTGAHVNTPCASCHVNGKFAGTPTDCYSCHQNDYTKTTNPNHQELGFPTTCQQCHSTTSWAGATFDHSKTGFPLTGAHINTPCLSCHVNGKFAGTPTDCYSCHQNDYNKTTDPNHAAAGFPTTCQTCHSTAGWSGANFDHSTTGFALTGAHATTPCASCHVNGRFKGTPTDCYSCHQNDYNKTTNPNHPAAGFPTDCSVCHSTKDWSGAQFDHSKTGFPLTGAHTSLQCNVCHVNNNYNLNPACSSCHMNDYNGTTNPNHKSAGFPTDCTICHTTTAWKPSTFNHNNTPFPLTGAHVNTPCLSCHINNQFAGTPTDCYSCHKTEYQNVTNPNHIAAGFPKTCQTCHSTTTWLGATFNHSWFPIYSGAHAGKWTTCNDCHTNSNDFAVFSCITCHAHDKSTMDAKHSGVRNYVYNSANCYSCHPTGRAD